MKNKFGYNIKHNKVFKADKTFVTEVAFRAFAAPQLPRQFCPLGKTVFTVYNNVEQTLRIRRPLCGLSFGQLEVKMKKYIPS